MTRKIRNGRKKGNKSNKRKRKEAQRKRKRNRNNNHVPFGIKYDYRSDSYESNLCLYRALEENCEYNDIPVGNSSNTDPVKWIKHQIARDFRRNDGEMGDTLDLINFIDKWGTKGHDIAIIVIDDDGNYMEGFVPELYRIEPEGFKIFVVEWQYSYHSDFLHFEAITDDEIIDDLRTRYLTETNEFLTWLD